MNKYLINITMILIAFALQYCIFPFIPFLSASPNFMVIIVFSFGFIYGSRDGIIYGLIAGILMDLFYSGPLGFFTLIFVWMGYLNGLLSRFYYDDYITLHLVMCTVNEILYNIFLYGIRFLIRGKTDMAFYLRTIIVPEMIITLLFTLLFYRLMLEYGRRMKTMMNKRGDHIA